MTRRTLGHYRIGSRPIPKVNGLASDGWEAERTREGRGRDAGADFLHYAIRSRFTDGRQKASEKHHGRPGRVRICRSAERYPSRGPCSIS